MGKVTLQSPENMLTKVLMPAVTGKHLTYDQMALLDGRQHQDTHQVQYYHWLDEAQEGLLFGLGNIVSYR